MAILVERTIALVKSETSYGVDASPDAATDFIAVADVQVNPQYTYFDPAAMDGSLSPRMGNVGGQRSIEVTFTHELQLDSSGTQPPCAPLIKACGFAEDGGEFTPVSSGFSSATIYVYFDGLLWKIVGARGNMEVVCAAGDAVKLNFTMRGLYDDPTDATFPASWTDSGAEPLMAMGGTFAWGTENPCIETLSVNMNNDLQVLGCIGDSYGAREVAITNRNPEGSANPDMTTLSEMDWHTLMNTPTLSAVTYTMTDGTNHCTISIPKAQIMEIGTGSRSNIRSWEIPFKCIRDSGDDELSLTFGSGIS